MEQNKFLNLLIPSPWRDLNLGLKLYNRISINFDFSDITHEKRNKQSSSTVFFPLLFGD